MTEIIASHINTVRQKLPGYLNAFRRIRAETLHPIGPPFLAALSASSAGIGWKRRRDLALGRRPSLAAMTTNEIERWSPLKAWLYSLLNRNPKSNLAAVELASLSADDRFLDVGCGPGAALEQAATTGAQVAGVDPSPSMVDRASKRVPAADVRVGSAEELPFPDDHFTVVANVASFHHWADRDAGLREILRVLAPAGRLHIMEGLLKEGKDGHGLNPGDVESLLARLLELGYADTEVDTVKTGWRHEYYVVTGIAPS
jgi:SAM-dependent methyltransferase